MPAKTPMYLKTTTPKRGKRLRLRDFLSGDMISPPMGEVRHSAHVGPEGEGDMFGDVGFLRGKMDMLPSLRGQNGRTLSMEREYAGSNGSHGFSYNDHAATGLLKTTVSMPVFISHEQAPPKPPRLHLEDPVAPPPPPITAPQAPPPAPPPSQPQESQHGPGRNGQTNGHGPHPRPVSRWDNNGGAAAGRATSDLDGAFRRLVPSSGSFSEASSEDSVSECCGPLDPRRGLSLDSDAGLSNEDLRSDSPCAAQLLASHAVAAPTTATTRAPRGSSSGAGVSRSESLAALDLDLGPSILDDVLGIMDRYRAVEDRWEL